MQFGDSWVWWLSLVTGIQKSLVTWVEITGVEMSLVTFGLPNSEIALVRGTIEVALLAQVSRAND